MAIKNFENFDYKFAKDIDDNKKKAIRIAALALAGLILIFACWSLIKSLDLFKVTTTQITQPVTDATTEEQKRLDAFAATEQKYEDAKIPYEDPKGRFSIEFVTPYVSDQIIVFINTPQDRQKIVDEANSIISEAKKTVEINAISYRDSY